MSEIPVCIVIKKNRKCLNDNCNKQPSFGLEKLEENIKYWLKNTTTKTNYFMIKKISYNQYILLS